MTHASCIGSVDLNRELLVVAEVGNNHEGDFGLAKELIAQAAAAGAQAVKFQTFCTEHYVSPAQPERFQRLKSFEFSPEQFSELAGVAKHEGILFLSTPFDLSSLAVLDPIVPALKIASGDNTFYPLLEAAARTCKPILLSTGLANPAEIQAAKARIETIWAQLNITVPLVLLHCVSAYPVPAEQANLAMIPELKHRFGGFVGYSDHTLGIEAAVLAGSLGANVIEKHFTLDHHYSDFRDHQLSATPDELKALVGRLQEVKTLLGDAQTWLQPAEAENLPLMRRHLAAGRNLPAGHILSWEDLTWIRPQGAWAPGAEAEVLGKRLTRDLLQGESLQPELLQSASQELP